MNADFLDTNVLLYLASSNTAKADRAEQLVSQGGTVSVQVLNEVANVARKKMRFSWDEVHTFLEPLRTCLDVKPITTEVHASGLSLAERYGLSLYDAMIVAAALQAKCERLWSEDMHHGLVVQERLEICNPFRG